MTEKKKSFAEKYAKVGDLEMKEGTLADLALSAAYKSPLGLLGELMSGYREAREEEERRFEAERTRERDYQRRLELARASAPRIIHQTRSDPEIGEIKREVSRLSDTLDQLIRERQSGNMSDEEFTRRIENLKKCYRRY